MKLLSQFCVITLFLLSHSVSFSATNTTDIELAVTENATVKLIGTAVGSQHNFTVDDLDNTTVSLGTLGVQSNFAGNCMMIISSLNNFKIKNMLSGDDLGVYSVNYRGNSYTAGVPNYFTQSCNIVPSPLDLVSPHIPADIPAGLYYGSLVITVITQ
jgi:hypothetical protein